MGLREQSTVCCLPELCFFQCSVALVMWGLGLRKQFINHLLFPTLACAAGFNNNNKNNINLSSEYFLLS